MTSEYELRGYIGVLEAALERIFETKPSIEEGKVYVIKENDCWRYTITEREDGTFSSVGMNFIGVKKVVEPQQVDPEFALKALKFMQNEIQMRCNIMKIDFEKFPIPAWVCGWLLQWEMEGHLTRKDTRVILDDICGIEKKKK